MSIYLILTEKPSVQRKFAKFLLEKVLKVVKYKKAVAYVGRRGKNILIIASLAGHLVNLDYPLQLQKGWKYPMFVDENRLTYKILPGKKPYLVLLNKLLKTYKPDFIVVATDVDREGSWLAAEILEYLLKIKPPYKNPRIKRMYFSAITRDEIIRAFENLQSFDHTRALAGRARAILDLQIGANITRALTKSAKIGLLSSGRVQGPTLYEIYKKEKEIEEFVPQIYYKIILGCNIKGYKVELISENKFYEEEKHSLENILKKIESKSYIDINVKSKIVNKKPLPPFNLSDLQKEAFSLFGFSPMLTKKIAQRLYERGLISYPRSGGNKWPLKYKTKKYFKEVILRAIFKFSPNLYRVVDSLFRWPPFEGNKEDPAHPPIHPVGYGKLSKKEFLLYELILRRTACTIMPDAKVKKIKLQTNLFGINFDKDLKKVLYKGWLIVYSKYLNLQENKIDLEDGLYKAKIIYVKIKKEKTKPPERFTPGSIIKWMEKENLGTKTTRDEILKKLYKRKYISGRKKIKITELGKSIVDALKDEISEILDKKLTARIEKDLDKIEKGEVDYREVIEKYIKKFEEILMDFKKKEKEIGRRIKSRIRKI